MASSGDFKYHAVAHSARVTHGIATVEVTKPKVYFVREGFSLKYKLRFGKGTDDPAQNITAVFDVAARNLEDLQELCTYPGTKPVQRWTWNCHQTPQISNYSTPAAPKTLEHQFTEILLQPGEKRMELVVPWHKKLWFDEIGSLRQAYSAVTKDAEAMLALYPNPSQPTKALPPIAECRPRAALDIFASREIWGATMTAAVLRESGVHLERLKKSNMEDCWGIFEKVDNGIVCHVYGQQAGPDVPHIINPSVGDRLKLDLRPDGHHELSAGATDSGVYAKITDVVKRSDFVIRLIGNPGWSDKDLNFGRLSTIRLERANVYLSSRRHLEAVELCYNTPRTPGSFPLHSLLLLNQPLPSLERPEIPGPVIEQLNHIHSLLNPTQQQAFRTSHDTRSPIVLIQGPPGTGKTLTLAMITIAYAVARRQKCLIATPSNNAGNEFAEKILGMWRRGTDPEKRPVSRPPNLLRWLTPATDQSIMNNARVTGIPEAMVEISMARTIQERALWAVRHGTELEKTVGGEWLDLWKRRIVLKEAESSRFRELTFLWEKRCLREAEIVITTCDNAYTLDPEAFPANIIILDECSQAIEPAALLPVVRFIKSLRLVILGGDDEQLQPFVISTPADNEFQAQLRKSWFERVRTSTVVPCITLGQQYRMRPEISSIVIRHFYKDRLVDDPSVKIPRPTYIKFMSLAESLGQRRPEWAASQWPMSNVLMVDMPEGARTFSKTDAYGSKYNSGHILIVRDLCLTLLAPTSGISTGQVVVITPYAAQRVRLIRALQAAASLNPELRNVVVSTVDKFQGQENEIIILDLVVRSYSASALGFMNQRTRLNVSISRARDVLIVIGDAHKYKRLLSKHKVFKENRLFLEAMCEVAQNTVLWKGDTSALQDTDTWDTLEDGMDDGEGEEGGGDQPQAGDAGPIWRY